MFKIILWRQSSNKVSPARGNGQTEIHSDYFLIMTAAACTTTPWSNHLHCPSIKFWWIARVQRCSYCASPGSSTLIASQFDRAAAQAALMQHRRPHQVFLQAVLNHNRCWTMYSVIFSRCLFSIESVSIDKPNFSHIILISCSLCLKIATWVITTNNLLSVFDQLSLCVTTPSVISATEFCQNIEETLKSWYMTDISALQFVKCCRTLHIALFLCSSP